MDTKELSPTSPPAVAHNVATKPAIMRRPSLVMKPLPSPSATSPPATTGLTPTSLTSKEWVVPPRPKPGRKPATDTPPTKRKAQNRAAQRAFRERRAARVGELEDQIKIIEGEYEGEKEELKETVSKLERQVEQYRSDLMSWVDRYRKLENDYNALKTSQEDISRSTSQQPQAEDKVAGNESGQDSGIGCGGCTIDTHCQCIDDALESMGGQNTHVSDLASEKRSRTPVNSLPEKRIKAEPSDAIEIDFTEMYSLKRSNTTTQAAAVSPSSAVPDPCGFCQDGTPCICAEMAAEQERAAATGHIISPGSRAGVPQLAQFTPPPSEGDVSNVASQTTLPSGCAGGPGTCMQCRSDPNSTLFCKSLAASRSQSAVSSSQMGAGGCCGAKNSTGGDCCMSQSATPVSRPGRATRSRSAMTAILPASSSSRPITLSCADAYTTLSRHPGYERAVSDIGTWLPKLHATDVPNDMEGRPALEIDAANVMTVLKDFDRRFGQTR